MAETTTDLAQYQTDHDILIELRTEMRLLRQAIKDSADGTQRTLDNHEERIRVLEDAHTAEQGRNTAFSWIGGITYAAIALIAGLIGSFIQAGKLW
jgi:hypothetical protein